MREIVLDEDSFLVSKTDKKGVILYANEEFAKIAGYKQQELIAQNHNIVRHPNMPKIVFNLLWDTLRKQNSFSGYVKNKTKNGGHYWVFATVTPDFGRSGEVIGYTSARRAPNRNALIQIEQLYSQLKSAESRAMDTQIFNDFIKEKETGYDEYINNLQLGKI